MSEMSEMSELVGGPEVRRRRFVGESSVPRGQRKDGVYETPGQHVYDGMLLPADCLPSDLDAIRSQLTLHTQDIVSVGFPKTGTTWMAEILYLICHEVDVETASKLPKAAKLFILDFNFTGNPNKLALLETRPHPRLISSHLPLRFFQRFLQSQETPKFVVSLRNPKDTLVSYFHFYRANPGMGRFDGDWEEFFELFKKKKLIYEDYIAYYQGWWSLRDHPNILIVRYEELRMNAKVEVEKVAKFLGHEFSGKEIDVIVEGTRFETMKANNMRNKSELYPAESDPDKHFFRKGAVGGWKDYFTPEQSHYVEQLCETQLTPSGLHFDW